eukprot:9053077-Pyramimonas_sp.AAC.1
MSQEVDREACPKLEVTQWETFIHILLEFEDYERKDRDGKLVELPLKQWPSKEKDAIFGANLEATSGLHGREGETVA